MRVLVGGLGYRNLRDHSIGVVLSDHLAGSAWPEGIAVEDVSYNPIAVVQWLEEAPFDRVILVAAVGRGRAPGTINAYRWDGALPAPEAIQQAIAEAVTGVIALDNTVVVGGHFGAWPDELVIVEVEPDVHEFGEEFSPAVAAIVAPLSALITRLATDDQAVAALPRAPLGAAASPVRAA